MKNNENTRKSFYIALAAIVAICIWIFVDITGSPDGTARIVTKEFKDIPIEYVGEESVLAGRGLMLLEEGTDTTVDVVLEGTRWDLAKVTDENIIIQADLAAITTTGKQTVSNRQSFTPRTLGQVITVKSLSNYTPTVNIGDLYSKSVDVHYEVIGNIAEGYYAGEIRLSHESIEIRGQKEALQDVSYAKVSLDIGTDAVSTVSTTLEYQYFDRKGNLLDSRNIHSDIETIDVTLPVNVTKELELTMNFQEAPGARLENVNVHINPARITVTGDADKLRNINKLVLADFDLLNLSEDTIYNYVIPIPDGCENLSGVNQASLKLSFKDMVSADVTTNRIRYDNLITEGKYVELLTTDMTVHVFGTAADVEKITEESLMVVADLTDYNNAVGSYTVPVKILIDSEGDIGIKGTYQVRLNISDHPPAAVPDAEGETPAEGTTGDEEQTTEQ